jgi:hypothetical protein
MAWSLFSPPIQQFWIQFLKILQVSNIYTYIIDLSFENYLMPNMNDIYIISFTKYIQIQIYDTPLIGWCRIWNV